MTVSTPPGVSKTLNSVLDQAQAQQPPKFEHCEVGPFRLPGIQINREQVTDEELAEMTDWARENSAYISTETLFSWRRAKYRDWFTLRWS